MKTIKYFSVLSLVMIFAMVSAVHSKPILEGTVGNLDPISIKYEVKVYLDASIDLCDTYLVIMTDEKGRYVAKPQIYVPGKNIYTFNEYVSLPVKAARKASFVLSGLKMSICPQALVTKPDFRMGPFFPGGTYTFELYPSLIK